MVVTNQTRLLSSKVNQRNWSLSGSVTGGVSKALGFKQELPLNEEVSFTIDTTTPGTYGFACGMDMVKGQVVVEA